MNDNNGVPKAVGFRTPSGGLPPAPRDRAKVLVDLARADVANGKWASAETNLRLALTFSPGNEAIGAELRALVARRDEERRSWGPKPR